jgi:DNA-binding NarL/FixJ family response regulator
MALRVVVADDHEAVRQGLRWMLAADDDIEIVGEAADGRQLLALLEAVDCDALLLDLSMPTMSGLDVLRELQATGRSLPVVVLTMHEDTAHVDRALALGASGYLLKSASRDEMVRALAAAATGGAYVQPSLAKPLLVRYVVAAPEQADEPGSLAPRHLRLLRALAAGKTNKELAHDLAISETTTKSYLKELYRQLGVSSRAGAVAYGLRHRLIR